MVKSQWDSGAAHRRAPHCSRDQVEERSSLWTPLRPRCLLPSADHSLTCSPPVRSFHFILFLCRKSSWRPSYCLSCSAPSLHVVCVCVCVCVCETDTAPSAAHNHWHMKASYVTFNRANAKTSSSASRFVANHQRRNILKSQWPTAWEKKIHIPTGVWYSGVRLWENNQQWCSCYCTQMIILQ